MALVEIPGGVNRSRYPEIDFAPNLGVRGNGLREEKMYVALGNDVRASERALIWAFHNSRGMKICILHIHQPARTIPFMGTKIAISMLEENQVKAYHESRRQKMHKIIDKYIQICKRLGVRAEKIWKEMDSIEEGIVQLVGEHKIKWLVMGASADKTYSRMMKEPKSKKAIHVCLEASTFCYIWFICKGNLIYTREGKLDGINTEVDSPVQASPVSGCLALLISNLLTFGKRVCCVFDCLGVLQSMKSYSLL